MQEKHLCKGHNCVTHSDEWEDPDLGKTEPLETSPGAGGAFATKAEKCRKKSESGSAQIQPYTDNHCVNLSELAPWLQLQARLRKTTSEKASIPEKPNMLAPRTPSLAERIAPI